MFSHTKQHTNERKFIQNLYTLQTPEDKWMRCLCNISKQTWPPGSLSIPYSLPGIAGLYPGNGLPFPQWLFPCVIQTSLLPTLIFFPFVPLAIWLLYLVHLSPFPPFLSPHSSGSCPLWTLPDVFTSSYPSLISIINISLHHT